MSKLLTLLFASLIAGSAFALDVPPPAPNAPAAGVQPAPKTMPHNHHRHHRRHHHHHHHAPAAPAPVGTH